MAHITRGERLALGRAYVKNHRAAWREQGFSAITVTVPDADKTEITALIDVIKFERLLTNVMSADPATVDFVSSRNMNTPADAAQMAELSKDSNALDPETGRRVRALISLAMGYATAMRQQQNRIEIAANSLQRQMSTALAVTYSNLSNANARLAIAIVDGKPRVASPVAVDKVTGKLVAP